MFTFNMAGKKRSKNAGVDALNKLYSKLEVLPKVMGRYRGGGKFIRVTAPWAPDGTRASYGAYVKGQKYKGTDGKWHLFTSLTR